MARPRAAQFGKDIGVSTNQAKKLINEGRRRKDGGSNVLEKFTMDSDVQEEIMDNMKRQLKRRKTAKEKQQEEIMGRMKEGLEIEAKDGKFVSGMGAAYMGNPREVKIR